ncbi:MAG: YdcF family protein [Pirellulales bacterium]
MLWLAFVLSALLACWYAARGGQDRPPRLRLAAAVIGAGLAVGAAITWPPGVMLWVMLAAFVQPIGLLWLGLLVLGIMSWRGMSRAGRVLWAVIWVSLTVLGNSWTGMALLAWLERDYRSVDPLSTQPLDAVLVLGGGTVTAPNGQAELTSAADRVALGARLYHAGRTPWLITSGSANSELYPGQRSPGESTAQIWQDLGISADRIVQIPGEDTERELIALAKLARERGWARLGLVTSAWHLPRAMNLARRHGVEVVPLPADFRGFLPHPGIPYLAPQIEGLSATFLGLSETRRYLRDR